MSKTYEVRITFSTPHSCNEVECGVVLAKSEWEAMEKTATYFTEKNEKIEITNITANIVKENKTTGHYFLGFIIID